MRFTLPQSYPTSKKVAGLLLATVITSICFIFTLSSPSDLQDKPEGISSYRAYDNALNTIEENITPQKAINKEASKLTQQQASLEDNQRNLTLLSELLHEYQSSELSTADKIAIRKILPEIVKTSEGRALIADQFFDSNRPNIAAAMYDLILDSRVKSVKLIEELVNRDAFESNDEIKGYLVDLISDLETRDQVYSQTIETFLADMSAHPNSEVRDSALSQWAWYVSKHKGILPVLDGYSLNSSAPARQELYEIIDAKVQAEDNEAYEIILALQSLQNAEYLGISEEERFLVEKIIRRLSIH